MKLENYSSDAPIYEQKFDQFNRYPFAKRVASIIARRNDSSSIVIGIYGAWGGGKTSVLNFIESELQSEEEVVCIRFNPWRYGDEDQMLINFFNDLVIGIGGTLESGKEKMGELIEKYVTPVATVLGKGDAAGGIASFFLGASIEELRRRTAGLLAESKKRVVILVDDIDRLEKNDIHAVFRLVKLTADFKNTAYVLAFDKHVVSAALQERYGAADAIGMGNSFLEKIIQIPLQLPPADSEELRKFCFSELDRIVELYDITLSEEDLGRFVNNFSKGLEIHLKTPRQAKLYSNILMFSLPILKDEVSVVDLMLIEGIKVFLPTVYTLIRDHKKLFLEDGNTGMGDDNKQREKARRRERIESAFKGLLDEDKENVKALLCYLFPKLNNVFGNVSYGRDWEAKWSEKQRICSPQYFQRYFTYGITDKDVSDIAINELLEYSKLHSVDEVVDKIKSIMTEKNVETFISKLRRLSNSFTSRQSKILANSIAKLGNSFPNPVQMFRSMNTFGQGAMFTGDCIENLNDKEEQIKLAEEVILSADSLSFAVECFIWFRRDSQDHPNPKGFCDQEYEKLARKLAERISKEFDNMEEDEMVKNENLPHLLSIWSKYGKPTEASNIISQKIQRDNDFVFTLLNIYTPTAYGEFGAKKSNFSKDNYEAIQKLIDPFVIVKAIEKVYSYIQIDAQYPEDLDIPRNEELARQFIRFYHDAKRAEELTQLFRNKQ